MADMAMSVPGLAGLFKTVLDYWEIVDAGRGYARDFNFLRGRLDNQLAMFLIWAQRMGFESPEGYNKELDNPLLAQPLQNSFAHLKLLFSDTDKLSKEYGLRIDNELSVSHAIHQAVSMLSSVAIAEDQNKAAFRRRYLEFVTNVAARHINTLHVDASKQAILQQQKDASIWRVTKWAIRHEKKFKELVKNVEEIVNDLKGLTDHFEVKKPIEDVAKEFVATVGQQNLTIVEETAAGNATVLSSAASIRIKAIETAMISARSLRSDTTTFVTAQTHASLVVPLAAPSDPDLFNFKDLATQNVTTCLALADKLESIIPEYKFQRRRLRELRDLRELSNEGWCTVMPVFDDRIDEFLGSFLGPKGTPYEDGILHVRINIPEDYPIKPPSMWFLTKVLHPNIDERGTICMDTLAAAWSPVSTLRAPLVSLVSLLDSPEWDDPIPDSPAAPMANNRSRFEDEARRWTKTYATGMIINPGERGWVLEYD